MEKLKAFINSWFGFILILLLVWQGTRYFQNQAGESAFEKTGLPIRTLAEAQKLGAESQKMIVAELSAKWCGTCQEMDLKLFSQADVKKALTEDFVYSRIDADSSESSFFMQTYGAQGYPTLVLLNSDGKLIKHLPLTFDATAFLNSLSTP